MTVRKATESHTASGEFYVMWVLTQLKKNLVKQNKNISGCQSVFKCLFQLN